MNIRLVKIGITGMSDDLTHDKVVVSSADFKMGKNIVSFDDNVCFRYSSHGRIKHDGFACLRVIGYA